MIQPQLLPLPQADTNSAVDTVPAGFYEAEKSFDIANNEEESLLGRAGENNYSTMTTAVIGDDTTTSAGTKVGSVVVINDDQQVFPRTDSNDHQAISISSPFAGAQSSTASPFPAPVAAGSTPPPAGILFTDQNSDVAAPNNHDPVFGMTNKVSQNNDKNSATGQNNYDNNTTGQNNYSNTTGPPMHPVESMKWGSTYNQRLNLALLNDPTLLDSEVPRQSMGAKCADGCASCCSRNKCCLCALFWCCLFYVLVMAIVYVKYCRGQDYLPGDAGVVVQEQDVGGGGGRRFVVRLQGPFLIGGGDPGGNIENDFNDIFGLLLGIPLHHRDDVRPDHDPPQGTHWRHQRPADGGGGPGVEMRGIRDFSRNDWILTLVPAPEPENPERTTAVWMKIKKPPAIGNLAAPRLVGYMELSPDDFRGMGVRDELGRLGGPISMDLIINEIRDNGRYMQAIERAPGIVDGLRQRAIWRGDKDFIIECLSQADEDINIPQNIFKYRQKRSEFEDLGLLGQVATNFGFPLENTGGENGGGAFDMIASLFFLRMIYIDLPHISSDQFRGEKPNCSMCGGEVGSAGLLNYGFPQGSVVRLACGHVFCSSCIAHHLALKEFRVSGDDCIHLDHPDVFGPGREHWPFVRTPHPQMWPCPCPLCRANIFFDDDENGPLRVQVEYDLLQENDHSLTNKELAFRIAHGQNARSSRIRQGMTMLEAGQPHLLTYIRRRLELQHWPREHLVAFYACLPYVEVLHFPETVDQDWWQQWQHHIVCANNLA